MRWLIIVILIVFSSCGSIRTVSVESVKSDSVFVFKFKHDSVFKSDSVYIKEKGDTVFMSKIKREYRYLFIKDTINVTRVDTIRIPIKVEKRLNRWECVKQETGGLAIGVIFAFIIFVAVRRFK